ncbi:MAG: hypothetical protein GX946_03615 [Oligosphaeraceae bacterium]|nr:hypothetical protein [Oligosphaeraceae bacterium]
MKKFLFFCFIIYLFSCLPSFGGGVELTAEGKTKITVVCWGLPDATKTGAAARADYAVFEAFLERFPSIFEKKYRAKYAANPDKYGHFSWRKEDLEVEFKRYSGITVQGMSQDTGPLMAIAGGVSPDVLSVNFRQSDTYIQEGFLYPLDKPEDGYFSNMKQDEFDFIVHPKILPVMKRKMIGEKKAHI